MKRHLTPVLLLAGLLATLMITGTARADREADLKESFKERLPRLIEAKNAGKVGETYLGYVEAVTGAAASDATIRDLISQENKDRREIYTIIAERQGTTVEKVAALRGEQNFQRAQPGHYLKGPDGKWTQKK
ncbi:MAG: YdbL family protein [Phycisphaeraceae bacterium]|nr:YdbL family protein [Phycisphaeraceae bacterium]